MYCWGDSRSGQAGLAGGETALPTVVPLGGVATELCAGDEHTCAVVDGMIQCWGSDFAGQRGDGDVAIAANQPRPLDTTLTGWTGVACGAQHTCGRIGQTLYCWGDLGSGRLGRLVDASHPANRPTDTAVLTNAGAVALGGAHSCAVTGTAVSCWGAFDGNSHATPTVVSLPITATLVSADGDGTCASSGAATYCWGNGTDGEAGDGDFSYATVPADPVVALTEVTALASGDQFHCALRGGGTVQCWGRNSYGQLGTGVVAIGFGPTRVGTDNTWRKVVTGDETTCALTTAGLLSCWGRNDDGQTGDLGVAGAVVDQPRLVTVTGMIWSDVGIGRGHVCAVTTTGAVYCWGEPGHGQLGVTAAAIRGPGLVPNLAMASAITTNVHGSCAATSTGRWCWGDNTGFALGVAMAGDGVAPTADPTQWRLASLGINFGCGVTPADQLRCWGADGSGQAGNGAAAAPGATPDPVGGIGPTVSAVAAAYAGQHGCAIDADKLYCWGEGSGYALGIGTDLDQPTPVEVPGPSGPGWTAVAAGARSTCGLYAGALYCWGTNDGRQLGVASRDPISSPRLLAIGPGWTQVSVAETHACAIKAGELYCWGTSRYGAIGVAGAHYYPAPTPVQF